MNFAPALMGINHLAEHNGRRNSIKWLFINNSRELMHRTPRR